MKHIALILLAALAACSSCSPMNYSLAYPGVPNLDRVDENVYRSGQITTEQGWVTVERLANGRRVHVIKLNFDHEGSDAIAIARGYDVIYLPIQPEGDQDIWNDTKGLFERPDEMRVAAAEITLAFASLLTSTDFYLVHCTHGQDRTGFVVGEHRVLHDGWTKAEAYDEMRAHHFHWEIAGLDRAWLDFTPPDAP